MSPTGGVAATNLPSSPTGLSFGRSYLLADEIVVEAVRRRGMHQAGTRFQRDMLAADDRHDAILERVLQRQHLQCSACAGADDLRAFGQSVARETGISQFGDQYQVTRLSSGSGDIRVPDARSPPGWQAASTAWWSRSPHRLSPRPATTRRMPCPARALSFTSKAHVDRGRGLVLVFHFGFGQRRLAIQAPVHRLAALIQIAALEDYSERADDVGFGPEIHGQVRMVPVAQHAEADEILLLPFDLLGGIGAAQFAELRRAGSPCRVSSPPAIRSAGRGSPSPARRARRSRPGSWT